MKKVLSVFLVVLCICSIFSVASIAASENYISYESNTTVTILYMPENTVSPTGEPCYLSITKDVPKASGFSFKCWQDAKGNHYFPNDNNPEDDMIYVNGVVVLYPVWVKGSGNTMDEISSEMADSKLYCVTYQNQTLSQVKMTYAPTPSVSFDGPGYVTVTKDTPIAIDHDFICWKDSNGKTYFEGDKVYVNGEVVLYAVWEEKTDSSSHVVRVIRAALATMQRILQKLLGIFKDVQDFTSDYYATEVVEP